MTTFFFSLMSVYTVQSVQYKTRNCKTMSKLKRSIDNWSLEVLFTVIMTVFARRNFKSYTAFIYRVHDEKWHSTQYSVVPVILYANHSRWFIMPTHFRTKSYTLKSYTLSLIAFAGSEISFLKIIALLKESFYGWLIYATKEPLLCYITGCIIYYMFESILLKTKENEF